MRDCTYCALCEHYSCEVTANRRACSCFVEGLR